MFTEVKYNHNNFPVWPQQRDGQELLISFAEKKQTYKLSFPQINIFIKAKMK